MITAREYVYALHYFAKESRLKMPDRDKKYLEVVMG
jgi:hypothetical protein